MCHTGIFSHLTRGLMRNWKWDFVVSPLIMNTAIYSLYINLRCGQLRHVFDSPFMGERLNLRLYKVTVCPLMTYGCEVWTLSERWWSDEETQQCKQSNVVGQTVRQAARSYTTSHDILKHIRVMGLNYLGLILRGDPSSLTFCAVHQQFQIGTMDVPPTPHTKTGQT